MQTKKEESDGSRRQQKDKHKKKHDGNVWTKRRTQKREYGNNHELAKDGLDIKPKQDFLKPTSSVLVITST